MIVVPPEMHTSSPYFYDREPTEEARAKSMLLLPQEGDPRIGAARQALGNGLSREVKSATLNADAEADPRPQDTDVFQKCDAESP